MILLDDENQLIHATIRKDLISKFKPILQEGCVYAIKNLKVLTVRGNYRPLTSKQMIQFMDSTLVTDIDDQEVYIRANHFEFASYSEINRRKGEIKYLTDVVGKIIAMSPIETVEITGGLIHKCKIKMILESDHEIDVTLCSKVADEFDRGLNICFNPPHIMIVTSTLVKESMGKVALASTYKTRIYINLMIPQTVSLFDRYGTQASHIYQLQTEQASDLNVQMQMFANR